jgi:hypothetical protein
MDTFIVALSKINLKCPICSEIMFNSVRASDNHSYHYYCITKYFNSNYYPKSKITNEIFANKDLIINKNVNRFIRNLIISTNLFDQHIKSLNLKVIKLNDHYEFDDINKFYNMILYNEKIKRLSKLNEKDMEEIKKLQAYKMLLKSMTKNANFLILSKL